MTKYDYFPSTVVKTIIMLVGKVSYSSYFHNMLLISIDLRLSGSGSHEMFLDLCCKFYLFFRKFN